METNIYYRFIMHSPTMPTMHSRMLHSPMCMEGELAALVALVALVALAAERVRHIVLANKNRFYTNTISLKPNQAPLFYLLFTCFLWLFHRRIR